MAVALNSLEDLDQKKKKKALKNVLLHNCFTLPGKPGYLSYVITSPPLPTYTLSILQNN